MALSVGWIPFLAPVLALEVAVVWVYFLSSWIKRWCGCEVLQFGGSKGNPLASAGLLYPLNPAEEEEEGEGGPTKLKQQLFPTVKFDATFGSMSPAGQKLLLLSRLGSFIFFLSVGVVYNAVDAGDFNLHFFTNWNVLLVTTYFACAFICSVVGFCECTFEFKARGGSGEVGWSSIHATAGVALNFLFELTGSTAFLITTVNFTLLSPELSLMNVSCHLATTCAFLLEMFLTRMRVNPNHLPFCLLWYVAYMAVIWPWVILEGGCGCGDGGHGIWPYPFLAVDTPLCFLWYSGLLIMAAMFYGVWWGLDQLKARLHDRFAISFQHNLKIVQENRAVEFLDQVSPFGPKQLGRPSSQLA